MYFEWNGVVAYSCVVFLKLFHIWIVLLLYCTLMLPLNSRSQEARRSRTSELLLPTQWESTNDTRVFGTRITSPIPVKGCPQPSLPAEQFNQLSWGSLRKFLPLSPDNLLQCPRGWAAPLDAVSWIRRDRSCSAFSSAEAEAAGSMLAVRSNGQARNLRS